MKKGEILALLGPNGAGKSTLIYMITGVYKADEGNIEISGLKIPEEKFEALKNVGFMPQEYALYEDLTPIDNMIFFGRLYGMSGEELGVRIPELLSLLEIEAKADVPVHKLSGGQKRRASLATALIHDPDILILDEPTVGVDPILRVKFWEYFRQLVQSGKTILLTTHVMDEATHADTVALMRRGKIVDRDTPDALLVRHGVKTLEEVFVKVSLETNGDMESVISEGGQD